MTKVLCVEDDFFIADIYERTLKKAGFDVTVVSDGSDVVQTVKESVYDVVLLDIMLPNKNGVEILEALRGKDGLGLPLTKIIVTTNFNEPPEDRAHIEKLADGYLIKADVTPTNLIELIKQVLQDPTK